MPSSRAATERFQGGGGDQDAVSRGRRPTGAAATGLLLALSCLASCGPSRDPSEVTVARLGSKTVTLDELEAYFLIHMLGEKPPEDVTGEELNQIKSRLLDNFLDEELLLAEAEQRGVRVREEEVEAYLRSEENEDEAQRPLEEDQKKTARRDLMIQKLREAHVRTEVQVTGSKLGAYLADHREELLRGDLVIRSLMLPSVKEAEKVREDVEKRRTTFGEAVIQHATTPGQGEPLELSLDSLPMEVQTAVRGLTPGQVSRPVELHGSTYLFVVDALPGERQRTEEELTALVTEELLRLKYEEATAALLHELRERVPIEVQRENLPFRYVAEDAS